MLLLFLKKKLNVTYIILYTINFLHQDREDCQSLLTLFTAYSSHCFFSLLFPLLFFFTVSPFLRLSSYFSLSFCFSLFAARRCVWSVVAAARVDSLITLPALPVLRSSSLLLVLRAPTQPQCRRRKRVKRCRRSKTAIRKSSSMNASTSPSALSPIHFGSLPPLSCEHHSSSAIIFGNLLQDKKNYLSSFRVRAKRKAWNYCSTFHMQNDRLRFFHRS